MSLDEFFCLISDNSNNRQEWIWDSEADGFDCGAYRCLNCGRFVKFKENFCPDCGAEMINVEDNKPMKKYLIKMTARYVVEAEDESSAEEIACNDALFNLNECEEVSTECICEVGDRNE